MEFVSNKKTKEEFQKYVSNLGHKTQAKERNMNDNLNTPTPGDMAEAHKVMDNFEKLSDTEFEALLAEGKPVDGEIVGYLTDADEASDEPTPTIH